MPIYEYKCAGCAEVFEVLVLRPTDQSQACPNCGFEQTEKLLSVTSSIISKSDSFVNCPMPMGGCPATSEGMEAVPCCARKPGMRGATQNPGGFGGGCPIHKLG